MKFSIKVTMNSSIAKALLSRAASPDQSRPPAMAAAMHIGMRRTGGRETNSPTRVALSAPMTN